jgi:hypothetical protein
MAACAVIAPGHDEGAVMPLAEGETGEFMNVGGVEYTGVSSCLTVTCKIAGVPDTYVGGHLSLQVPAGKLDSSQVLPDMRRLINGRQIERVHLAGVLDQWSDEYFSKPLFTGAGAGSVQNYDPLPQVSAANTLAWVAVGNLVGLDYAGAMPKISTETRTGAFTITL